MGKFPELTATAWEQCTLNTGARVDLAQRRQTRIRPRANARYQLFPLLHLRGAYGQGFEFPGLASLGDPVIGNPGIPKLTPH